MKFKALKALCDDVERAAYAIASSDIGHKDMAACWQQICMIGVNINGYGAKASWIYDQVIVRVKAIRRAWNMEAVA